MKANLENLSVREFGRTVLRMSSANITVDVSEIGSDALRTSLMTYALPGREAWHDTMELVQKLTGIGFGDMAFGLSKPDGTGYTIKTQSDGYFCRIKLWWPTDHRKQEANRNTDPYSQR